MNPPMVRLSGTVSNHFHSRRPMYDVQNFEADVVTKDNSLADKILVDKNTGWMRPAY